MGGTWRWTRALCLIGLLVAAALARAETPELMHWTYQPAVPWRSDERRVFVPDDGGCEAAVAVDAASGYPVQFGNAVPRFDLAAWGPPRDNVWMMAVMGVIRAHVEVPPATPRAPGPFAFEDIDYLRDLLADAGFARIDIDDWRGDQAIGGPGRTPAEAADFALGSMSAARVLSEAGADVMAAARADLERVYAEYKDSEAGVRLGARAWLVTAA